MNALEKLNGSLKKATLIEIMVALAIILILVSSVAEAILKSGGVNGSQELYSAWMKVNKTQNLSYEEWSALRRNNMLPGQIPDRTTIRIEP